ncbi:hypothetical protein BpHYR1_016195 [Brachionus plicatilis]|uniref:Retrotransposon gag domain-containing protein n=1 Tax=Brachionus plicatilis TaxID=10195 RepID=A0A3M7QQ38_BRAPC|nr:hypothetical protein BpHYR1_016195 [Brachionus plicatilis]
MIVDQRKLTPTLSEPDERAMTTGDDDEDSDSKSLADEPAIWFLLKVSYPKTTILKTKKFEFAVNTLTGGTYMALFKTLAWYCREGRTFYEEAFKRFKNDKAKDFSNLQKYNENFKFEPVRPFVEEYFTSVDVSKLTDHELKIIENHQKHEIFFDCDVLDDLKQHMCRGSDTVEKKTNFNATFINNIEPLSGNEDDVDECFNQYDKTAFANGWTREKKGENYWYGSKKKPLIHGMICLKKNNVSYLQEFFNQTQKNGETIDDYSATLKKAFNKAFKSSASEDVNKALLGRFRTSILPEIQSIMCTKEPKNYEEAVELASK